MKVPYIPPGGHVARSVENSPWSFLDKRPFPGVLGLIDEPVAATLAEKEGEFFEHLLLEILRIRFLDLLEDSPHLSVHSSLGLGEDTVEVGKYPYMNHITVPSGLEFLSAPVAESVSHGLPRRHKQKVIESLVITSSSH